LIEARIVADSVAPSGKRLTTFVVTYPRFILAELNTHRMLSRNSASSRAIPISKMLKAVFWNPALPVTWGENGKGMQAKKTLSKSKQRLAKLIWVSAAVTACGFSWLLSKAGVHKQLSNRITEPFSHMTTIISATEFENLFSLRAHPDAQPEFQELAFKMMEAYLASKPKELQVGEWHLPFADKYVDDAPDVLSLLKISAARCARVSYLSFEGDIAFEKDYKLHDTLISSGHMSPMEHQAKVQGEPGWSGNFYGFTQYRKTITGEARKLSREDMASLIVKRGENK
jgi:thymidylate synthase ThyX